MSPPPEATFGQYLAERRRLQGFTQVELAELIGKSESWVQHVEGGSVRVDNVRTLKVLATHLDVPAHEMVTAALGPDEEPERSRPYVEVLRQALAGHPAPRAVLDPVARRQSIAVDQAELTGRRDEAWRLLHASKYQELGVQLAELIRELELVTRLGPEADRPALTVLLASTYQAAASMLVKLDDQGAGWIAADRAISAGERCGDRGLVLAGQLRMARTFLDAEERDLARHVLREGISAASDLRQTDDLGLLALGGACAQLLAVIDARNGEGEAARRNIEIAQRLAGQLGGDRNDYDTEFGPTNVAMHRVAIEVELGNGEAALREARKVPAGVLSPERQARYLVDVARAHAQRRDIASALQTIEAAEAIAPEEIAELSRVRQLVADLEHLAGNRPPTSLRSLRARITRN